MNVSKIYNKLMEFQEVFLISPVNPVPYFALALSLLSPIYLEIEYCMVKMKGGGGGGGGGG